MIQAGHSVIVDAVYADAGERAGIAGIAEERQAAFRGLFLSADTETRLSRVANRSDDASEADRTIALQQPRYDFGTLDWIPVDASGTPEETLVAAQKKLAADLARPKIFSSPHRVHPNSFPRRTCSMTQHHFHAVVWIDHHEARIFHFNSTDVERLILHPDRPTRHIHHKANSIGSGSSTFIITMRD